MKSKWDDVKESITVEKSNWKIRSEALKLLNEKLR